MSRYQLIEHTALWVQLDDCQCPLSSFLANLSSFYFVILCKWEQSIYLKDDVKNILILMNETLNHKNVSKVAGVCKLANKFGVIFSNCNIFIYLLIYTILLNQNKILAASLESSKSLCNIKRTFSAIMQFKCPDIKEGLKPLKKKKKKS